MESTDKEFQKKLDAIVTKKKTFEMQILKRSTHQIIGTKGKMIRRIIKVSGAKINIDTSAGIINIITENSDSLTIANELISKVISNPTTLRCQINE